MCLAQVRGSNCSVYADDDECEDGGCHDCVVSLDGDQKARDAISELGKLFGVNGVSAYCDWACVNGAALVEALAKCAS